MNFSKTSKKFDFSSVVEKVKKLKEIAECVAEIEKYCVNIGAELASIGVYVAAMIQSGSIDNVKDIRECIETIEKIKAKIMKEVDNGKKLVEELKKLDGNEEGGDDQEGDRKKGKVERIIDETLSLLRNVCSLIEKVEPLVKEVMELLEAPPDQWKKEGQDVLDVITKIKDDVKAIQEDVVDIKNIITGSDKDKKEKSEKKKSEKKLKKIKEKEGSAIDQNGNKATPNLAEKEQNSESESDDENPSCWAKFKACLCCKCCCKESGKVEVTKV